MDHLQYKYSQLQKQRPTLHMGISHAMRQSLEVLQMPLQELTIWLQQEIEQNPFLEWNDSTAPLNYTFFSWDIDQYDVAYRPSLFEHLMQQAKIAFTQPHLLQIATWILGNLEPSGFFSSPKQSCPLLCNDDDWDVCLRTIKQFDPPGIGAQDLQDCLLLQLKAFGKTSHLSFHILSTDIEDLYHQNFCALQKKYQISSLELKEVLQEIAVLDPFPGHRFQSISTPPPIIDATLHVENTALEVEVLQPSLPNVKQIELQTLSEEEKKICIDYQIRARFILTCIQKRTSTLHKIIHYLVCKQKAYLLQETEILIPINAKTIAQDLFLHESTVTRALSHKNLSSPRGILQLKKLLSTSLSEEISSDYAQKLLTKLVQEENKHSPLSDQQLLEKMLMLGVPCARRTIAKYRSILRIPSSRKRQV